MIGYVLILYVLVEIGVTWWVPYAFLGLGVVLRVVGWIAAFMKEARR